MMREASVERSTLETAIELLLDFQSEDIADIGIFPDETVAVKVVDELFPLLLVLLRVGPR